MTSAKKPVSLCASVVLACLLMVGCGRKTEEYRAAFVGTWEIVELTNDGALTTLEDMAAIKANGLDVYVDLREDGTSELDTFGSKVAGTWEVTGKDRAKMSMREQSIDMKLDNDMLELVQDAQSITFKKIDPADRRMVLQPVTPAEENADAPSQDEGAASEDGEEASSEMDEAA